MLINYRKLYRIQVMVMSDWIDQAKEEMEIRGFRRVSKMTVRGLISELEQSQQREAELIEAVGCLINALDIAWGVKALGVPEYREAKKILLKHGG
jgi:hypothetical protein